VTTTGDFIAGRWASAKAIINIDKNAQVNVGGTLNLGASESGNGTINLTCDTGETASLSANRMIVGGINSSSGWAWSNGTFNVSGKAKATVTNDLIIGQGFNAWGAVNVYGNASLNVGSVTLGAANGAGGKLNVYDNAVLSVTGNVDVSVSSGATDTPTRQINVYNNGTTTVGGNLTVGARNDNGTPADPSDDYNVSGTVNITDNGILKVAGTTTLIGGSLLNISNSGSVDLNDLVVRDSSVDFYSISPSHVMEADCFSGHIHVHVNHIIIDVTWGDALSVLSIGDIDSPAHLQSETITVGTLNIDNGIVTAKSVSVDTLTIGAGSTLVINAISGGPSSGGELTLVPEPSTFVLLAIAALGLIGGAWRRRNS